MGINKVRAYAKSNGWDGIVPEPQWNGYNVYSRKFSDAGRNDMVCVGLPLVILEKEGKIRMSTPSEALERLESLDEE